MKFYSAYNFHNARTKTHYALCSSHTRIFMPEQTKRDSERERYVREFNVNNDNERKKI